MERTTTVICNKSDEYTHDRTHITEYPMRSLHFVAYRLSFVSQK